MTSHQRGFKSYWSNPNAPVSLGCLGCPELSICGGQKIAGHGFNCLDHCCGHSADCDVACPKNKLFVERLREVSGLHLNLPSAAALPPIILPKYVPLVFHGSSRVTRLDAPIVALPLYRFFGKTADCRFGSREELCSQFGLNTKSDLILSGVARDPEVERWWGLQRIGRLKAIANLRRLGIVMVTSPNFSVIVDRPRWDDMHSMKRIAEVYHEFLSEGMHAALHVNGRTERDFERWAEFIASHREVTHLAFEFTTGNKPPVRMKQHADWLIWLAQSVGRRLGLVIRGGTQIASLLSAHFDLTFLDTSPFEKAHHRFIVDLAQDGKRRWLSRPTEIAEPIDDLLSANITLSERWFNDLIPKFSLAA